MVRSEDSTHPTSLREIAQTGDELFTILADMNSQTPEVIEANNFELLKRAIDERLKQLAADQSGHHRSA